MKMMNSTPALCVLLAVLFSSSTRGMGTTASTEGEGIVPPSSPKRLLTGEQYVRASDGEPGWLVQLRNPRGSTVDLERRAKTAIDTVLADAPSGIEVRGRYDHAFIGFSAFMSPKAADSLSRHPLVVRVEPDLVVQGADDDGTVNPDLPDSWGLRRISSPDGLAPAFDSCGADGQGVNVIIVDSGINPAQTEFSGRIATTLNFYPDDNPSGADTNGHGTRSASIAAGSVSGVARGSEITSLRVLGPQNSGSIANVVSGLNWIANPSNIGTPAVVNMSLATNWYGNQMFILGTAINAVLNRGIPIFAAAGNSSLPTYMNYPAAKPGVCAVGASDVTDKAGIYSNFGTLVGIWAPGSLISSADWKHPDGGLMLRTGTSAASPFAAGVAAQFLQRYITESDYDSPRQVVSRTYLSLMQSAAEGRLSSDDSDRYGSPWANGNLGGSANRLLQVCPEETGAVCGDTLEWIEGSASIVFGDGIGAVPPGTTCRRTVWNPAGPVNIMFNAVAIGTNSSGSPLSTLRVIDRSTGSVVWDAATSMGSGFGSSYESLQVTSSTNLGLEIEWTSSDSATDPVGHGYAATALVVGACPGDIDGDGVVGGADLAGLLVAWGACPIDASCLGDLNLDGLVDGADLAILLGQWGACPEWTPPGFIRDCNGTPVPGGLIGDNVLDDGSRIFIADPANLDPEPTSVDLDCEKLAWDTLDDFYAISPSDPRIGACTTPGGDCTQSTLGECTAASGVFWGRNTSCADVGEVLQLESLECSSDAIATGYPPAENLPFVATISADAIGNVFRQRMPAGLTSISRLRFLAAPRPLGYGQSNISGVTPGRHGLAIGTTPYRIVITFTDGGPDMVVDTHPQVDATIQSSGPVSFERCTVNDLLAPQDREVESIGIRMVPRGPYIVSTESAVLLAGGYGYDGASDLPAETSPDGGVTWYPIESPSQTGQFSLCVEP